MGRSVTAAQIEELRKAIDAEYLPTMSNINLMRIVFDIFKAAEPNTNEPLEAVFNELVTRLNKGQDYEYQA